MTLSGGLLGPFENPPTRPGSRGGFLPWTSGKSGMSSKLRPPGSKLKEPAARPRGDGEGSSRPPSRGPSSPSESLTPRRPSISRESSQSRLPVFKRESSMPQISRDLSVNTPSMRREKSELPKLPKKTPTAPTPRGSSKPIMTESTPKTVAERKVADRNIAAKGTRSAISGISDKIMIGDKVLITASNKIGMVQFIGETKFAKGIWAGVVLEDVAGKNDGSVSGVRYFTCPALRGVFVKEEKLEKITNNVNTPTSNKTPLPTSKTPAQFNRNESALSIDSGVDEDQELNVGDQVYITSANATRIGFLRYMGLTEFAKGTWCGIELLEPTGKNDGAVAGTRYFQCEVKYGIFAQVHKVKKYRTCNSSDSSGPLSPPVPKIECLNALKESQTEEELTINVLEAVLQDELCTEEDKSQSSPVVPISSPSETEVAIQPNDVSSSTTEENILRKSSSAEKMILDTDLNTIRLQSMVSSLEKEKTSLENEVSESKHKIEDLQFQLEEQMMISDEMTKGSSDGDEKVQSLEKKLAEQIQKVSLIQSEMEELKTQHEEDIFLLNEKDSQLQSKEEAIIKFEQVISTSKLNEEQLETFKQAGSSELKTKIDEIAMLKESIKHLELQNTELKDNYENKLNEKESSNFSLEESVMELENKISLLTCELDAKTTTIVDLEHEMNRKTNELVDHVSREDERILEINELTQQIQTKQTEIASLSSSGEDLNSETLELKASIEVLEARNKQLADNNTKLEEDIINASRNSGDSAQQLTHLNEQLQTKNREIDSLKDQESVLTAENNKLLQQLDDTKEKYDKEISYLLKDKDEEIKKLEESVCKLEENFKKAKELNEEMENKVHQLEKDLTQANNETSRLNDISKSKDEVISTMTSQIEKYNSKLDALKNVEENLQSSTKEVEKLSELNESKDVKISELDLELQNLNNQLRDLNSEKQVATESKQKELNEVNSDLETLRTENNELRNSYNTINEIKISISERLTILENDKKSLTETIVSMKAEKDKLVQEKDSVSNIHDNIKEKTDQIYKEKESLENDKEKLQSEKNELENKYKTVSEELKSASSSSKRYEEEKNMAKKEISESSKALDKMHEELTSVRKELQDFKAHFCSIEEENKLLNEKKDEVTDRRKSLEDKVAVFKKMEAEMAAENARLQEQLKLTIERESSNRINKETECANLQVQVKEFISRITVLENNNSLLQFELDELQQKNAVLMSSQGKKLSKKSSGSPEHDSLREDVENLKFINMEKEKEKNQWFDQQLILALGYKVEFLNSIIVDLQKKNKEQKDKIDILAYGDDIHELNGHTNLNESTSDMRSILNSQPVPLVWHD